MSKFKSQGFRNTFKNARKGMRLVLKSERNVRIHLVMAAFVLMLGFFTGFQYYKTLYSADCDRNGCIGRDD